MEQIRNIARAYEEIVGAYKDQQSYKLNFTKQTISSCKPSYEQCELCITKIGNFCSLNKKNLKLERNIF